MEGWEEGSGIPVVNHLAAQLLGASTIWSATCCSSCSWPLSMRTIAIVRAVSSESTTRSCHAMPCQRMRHFVTHNCDCLCP